MRNRFIYIRIVYSFLLLMVVWPGKAYCQENESGRYPLYNFTPKDYGQHPQNWCAVQDHRGIMYFGNNSGVLEYDGVHWTLVAPSDGRAIYSLAADRDGRIYFGSINEFGYLAPDSIGMLEYHLVSDLLVEEDMVFNEIWKTHITDEGVIFQGFHHLFIWKNDSLQVIHSEEEINESFLVGNRVFFSYYDSNLSFLQGNEIVDVNGGEVFTTSFIKGMLQRGKNSILIVTGVDGFYQLEYENDNPTHSKIGKVRSSNERLFANRDIFNMQSLGSNRISLGTWGFGALIIDTLLNVHAVINKKEGLQDQIIQGQYVDEAGNLWLALSKGISRIETQSALTHFNDKSGLEGTVQTITRFGNRIYATTNFGLFYMDQMDYAPGQSKFTKPVFKMFPELDFECWDMIVYKEGNEELLLVLTNDEIYEITKDHRSRSVLNNYPYKLHQSSKDPKRVFVGLESGIMSIYRQGKTWVEEGPIEGVYEKIRDIYEDGDDLWLGTSNEGVLLLQDLSFRRSESPFISRYSGTHGLPEGPFIISELDNRITLATSKGLYSIDEKEEFFFPDSIFGKQFSNGTYRIHRIRQHPDLGIFMVTRFEESGTDYDLGYAIEHTRGVFSWVNKPFKKFVKELIHGVFIEEGGIVWLGGSDGIFRYEPNSTKNYSKDFNVFVRKVESSEGEVIFGGAYSNDQGIASLEQPISAIYDLPYRKNSLIFSYSGQADEDESFTEFSYFLEGNDKRWSDWDPEPKSVYTNLHEGKYTFYVKARNIYGHNSSESRYEFTIMAPWFRTTLAYVIYILLAVAIVYVIVVLYTRRLRAIIKDRTAEVVSQKEVIEEKNNELTDSILYAEKIQRAMIPPEDDLAKMNLDGFIFFKPLNIVSGDFYWLGQKDNKLITVAADCTGHGVPGAFMSMLGVAYLNNIVEARGIAHAGAILDELRAEVISALKQTGESGEQKDGMDMALHVIDFENMKMEFAGANNPLIMIRDKELIQYKGDRMPIGIHELADQSFENQEIDIQKGDVIYTFSDGFQDQFGGEKNKKFMIKRLKELFLEIHQKPMSKQKEILEKTFYDWMVPYGAEQIDDVIVIGIRI